MRIYPNDFSAETTRDAGPTVIQTTLYDLIDAIGEEAELDEKALISDIVMYVLGVHRVSSPGRPLQRMAGAL
jgi:hypothetical protein